MNYRDEYDYYEEEDYIFQRDSERKIKSSYDDFIDYDVYTEDYEGNEIRLSEEEQIQMALSLSTIEIESPKDSKLKDIRCPDDMEIGMNVEIFLIGYEQTRQRTIGTITRIINTSPIQTKGVLVELEYGIVGHVTALHDYEYLPTEFSLSHKDKRNPPPDNINEDDLYLWVESPNDNNKLQNEPPSKDIQLCPIGCGTNLISMSITEVNEHVDSCLNK